MVDGDGGYQVIKEVLQCNSVDHDVTVVPQYTAKMKVIYPVGKSWITFSARSSYHVNFSLTFLSILAAIIVLYQQPKTLLAINM